MIIFWRAGLVPSWFGNPTILELERIFPQKFIGLLLYLSAGSFSLAIGFHFLFKEYGVAYRWLRYS